MTTPKNRWLNWLIFIALSCMWGSSFILMKRGLYDSYNNPLLNPWQIASLRLLCAGIVLIPFAIPSFRQVPRNKWGYILLSGLLGSFLPAFLFCIAETKIDSGLAGALNSLTPVFVIISGFILYGTKVATQKITGILVALIGCLLLLLTKEATVNSNIWFAGFALLGALCYALNINMVRKHLQDTGSMQIASLALSAFSIPSLIVLLSTGYFDLPLSQPAFVKASLASAVLGIMSTSISSIIFYILVKRAGAIFSSMVTYGIPVIAISWGLLDNEHITALQVLGLVILLMGVFISNRS